MERENSATPWAVGLTSVGMLAWLIPHAANFNPTGSACLFAGGRLRGWRAYLLPLLLMAASEPLRSLVDGVPVFSTTRPFVYASFLISIWIGRRLQHTDSPWRIGFAAALSSVQFFVVTNLAFWAVAGIYPHTTAGLITCFAAAIPFFGRTLAGNIVFSAVLFGVYASRRVFQPIPQPAS